MANGFKRVRPIEHKLMQRWRREKSVPEIAELLGRHKRTIYAVESPGDRRGVNPGVLLGRRPPL